jgi:hypothetical protein
MTSREKFNEGRCILLQLLHKRSQPSDIIIIIFIGGSNFGYHHYNTRLCTNGP